MCTGELETKLEGRNDCAQLIKTISVHSVYFIPCGCLAFT